MTDKEIIKENKLIAEFMGYKLSQYHDGDIFWSPDGLKQLHINELDFNSDWSLLMPVAEKIEAVGCIVQIWKSNAAGCKITKVGNKFEKPKSFVIEGNSLMKAIYETVVAFIKWHNETN